MKKCSIKSCEEPGVHGLIDKNDVMQFFCVRHYDEVVDWAQGIAFEGSRPISVSKFKQRNPGVLR